MQKNKQNVKLVYFIVNHIGGIMVSVLA